MNLTETESRVREATNNEPWGASTTLMSQIAAGTYNYREREEIVGFIFRRFTEKAANEWRQIYKSLQLLEYLIKNGSERIIDDIRNNSPLITMLKSFHYIDSKGRDQGINVRNRAKNLADLLKDDSLIRSERKKARANAKKFGGVSSAAYGGASSEVGNHLNNDDYNSRVFGDGGVYGARYGDTAESYNTQSNSPEAEDELPAVTGSSKPTTKSSKINALSSGTEPDLLGDLLEFNGNDNSNNNNNNNNLNDNDDDDDFDDFQAAPSSSNVGGLNLGNLSNLYQSQPSAFQANVNSNVGSNANTSFDNSTFNATPNANYNISTTAPSKVASSSNNDAFSSLFSSAKTKTQGKNESKSTNNNTASTTNHSTSNNTNSNSNNINNNNNNNNSNTNSDDIDLLSF